MTMLDREAEVAASPRSAPARGSGADALTVFAVLWAMAALFHVWANPRASSLLRDVTLVGVLHVVLSGVAIAVVVRPTSRPLLLVLAALVPVTAWTEAPFMGNHFLVMALVDLALLVAAATSVRGRGLDSERMAARFLPAARWVLIVFYSFASFSKLNPAFLFDPKVSCGTFYFDELAGSWGASTPLSVGGAGWAHLVPLGVVAIELAVPILLLVRRTRHAGVVLALVFHSLIGYDRTHLFMDFSGVLVALFPLFLPPAWSRWVVDQATGRWRDWWPMAQVLLAAGSLLVVLGVVSDPGTGFRDWALHGRIWLWAFVDVLLLGAVLWWLARPHAAPISRPLGLDGGPAWLLLVPALAAANGLTPYLEIKTAYGFNMYSNLVTVDGDSNHLVIPRTLPLTSFQGDRVRIESSDDPNLQLYADEHYDLAFLQLRDYLSRNPRSGLRYQRDGQEHEVVHASDDPALVAPVPAWEARLFAFRAIDQQDPARCQPTWFPAR